MVTATDLDKVVYTSDSAWDEGWHPIWGSSIDLEPNINVTQFGDGYELRTADGINTQKEKWSLTFEGTRDEIEAIDRFLRAKGGLYSFNWVTPDHFYGHPRDSWNDTGTILTESHKIRVVCRSWSRTRNAGYQQLTCTFEQVFEY